VGTKPRSLVRTLIVRLLTGLTVLSFVVSGALYLLARQRLVSDFDEALGAKARALASLVQEDVGGKLEFQFADEFMHEFSKPADGQFFELWRPDTSVLERSISLRGNDLPRFGGSVARPEIRQLPVAGVEERPCRAAGIRFQPQLTDAAERRIGGEDASSTQTLTLVLARNTTDLQRTLGRLLGLLLLSSFALPVGAALIVGFAVRRELAPVVELRKQVELLGLPSLDGRVLLPDAPAELLPIERAINTLLDRMAAAFARERRFTSDVSHELKTPIAEALTALSLAERWGEDSALQLRARADSIAALRRMQKLVETLLSMAREETIAPTVRPMDLRDAVEQCVARVSAHAEARQLRMQVNVHGESFSMIADPILVESAIMNLLQNAVHYAPAQTEVYLEVTCLAGERPTFYCTNDAGALSPDDVKMMTEPFWRKDESRTDGEQHSGLGLAVVQSLCRRMGAELLLELLPKAQLRAAIVFEEYEKSSGSSSVNIGRGIVPAQ
jgi:two-component system sensor histidine kinase QseC